jgi:hypothetical protein
MCTYMHDLHQKHKKKTIIFSTCMIATTSAPTHCTQAHTHTQYVVTKGEYLFTSGVFDNAFLMHSKILPLRVIQLFVCMHACV